MTTKKKKKDVPIIDEDAEISDMLGEIQSNEV